MLDNELYLTLVEAIQDAENSNFKKMESDETLHLEECKKEEIVQLTGNFSVNGYYVEKEVRNIYKNMKLHLQQFSQEKSLATVINDICYENNISLSEVVKKARDDISKGTIYRLANLFQPTKADKKTLLLMCFYLNTNVSQAHRLLNAGGFLFAKNSVFDMIALKCIEDGYSMDTLKQLMDLYVFENSLQERVA